MNFIELHANDCIHFINPAQIIQAIGHERDEPPEVTVMLAAPSEERKGNLMHTFHGDDARRVFEELRMIAGRPKAKRP
jgi:hypothetical protein